MNKRQCFERKKIVIKLVVLTIITGDYTYTRNKVLQTLTESGHIKISQKANESKYTHPKSYIFHGNSSNIIVYHPY